MKKFILLLIMIFFNMDNNLYSKEIPQFKITAQHGASISILIPKNTKRESIKDLIFAFREARENNSFSELIPPSATKGFKENLSTVQIFVFDNSEYASQKYLEKRMGKDTDPLLEDILFKNISSLLKNV